MATRRGTRSIALAVFSALGSFASSSPAADARYGPLYLDEASVSADATAPEASEAEPGLLMSLLDRAGVASPLRDANINLFGYVEGSYTYNAGHSTAAPGAADVNNFRFFDFEHNEPLLNQLALIAERPVAPTADDWDVGFRVELLYGADSRFLQSNGMNFYGSGVGFLTPTTEYQPDPENQLALYQAYADVAVPVGNGLRVRLGKFASFFGSAVDPNQNSLYSHTFAFGFARPLTFTGVLASYPVSDTLLVEGGVNRGWEQSLEDDNGAISGMARVIHALDDNTELSLAGVAGPENEDDNGNYWTLVEATLRHRVSDQLSVALDATLGDIDGLTGYDVVPDGGGGVSVVEQPGQEDLLYYGLAGYVSYVIDDRFTLNGRAEFLRVEDGAFIPANAFLGIGGFTLYEVTAGVTVTPFPQDRVMQHLKIRPEVRWDYATESLFNNYGDHDQVTFAVDAIFNF